ncbi:excalibur calcium-binding domain-containing protein, partial [Basilea psittacipulmonis]
MKLKLTLSILLMSLSTTAFAARCADFATQAQAQQYMEQHNDKSLDRDGDGVACEHLAGAAAVSEKARETISTTRSKAKDIESDAEERVSKARSSAKAKIDEV